MACITRFSLQILLKPKRGYFRFPDFWSIHYIWKLSQLNLDQYVNLKKKNMTTSKRLDDDVMSTNCGVIVFFSIMANLQPSGSWISETWSIKFTFSLIVTFGLRKCENRTKNSLKQLSYECFEQRHYFC